MHSSSCPCHFIHEFLAAVPILHVFAVPARTHLWQKSGLSSSATCGNAGTITRKNLLRAPVGVGCEDTDKNPSQDFAYSSDSRMAK